MPMVKLSIFQDPVEVPEDELPVLRAQGLLVEATSEAAPEPVIVKATKTVKETVA